MRFTLIETTTTILQFFYNFLFYRGKKINIELKYIVLYVVLYYIILHTVLYYYFVILYPVLDYYNYIIYEHSDVFLNTDITATKTSTS